MNSFSNISTSKNESLASIEQEYANIGLSGFQAIGTGALLGTIIVGAIVGNLFVIISVFMNEHLRNARNAFFVSLAFADISVAIFVMPFSLAYRMIGKWIFGWYTCRFWLTCDILSCGASILNLCAIALDRYWAVHNPINYVRKHTLKFVLCVISVVWMISIISSLPPLFGWNNWPDVFTADTPCQHTSQKGFVIYSATVQFFVPVVVLIVAYSKIYKTTRYRMRVKAKSVTDMINTLERTSNMFPSLPHSPLASLNQKVNSEISGINATEMDKNILTISSQNHLTVPGASCSREKSYGTVSMESNHRADESARISPAVSVNSLASVRIYMEEKKQHYVQNERKTAQTLSIVMGVFLLCLMPFFVMYITVAFCKFCYITEEMITFITWLRYLSSTLNPIIYTVFNNDFRKSLLKVVFKQAQNK